MIEIEITDENFYDYFTPVTKRRPLNGEVIASLRAIAELVDGGEKRQIISLLRQAGSAISATKIMGKLCHAIYEDCVRVLKEMTLDLIEMSDDEVAAKPYKYTVELFYYTRPEHIPADPHWTQISILNADKVYDILEQPTEGHYKRQFDVGTVSDSEVDDSP